MKLRIGFVYLAALLVGSIQCGFAAPHKGPVKGKAAPKPAGWNSGLSDMMNELETQVGPNKGSPSPSQPADPSGPDTMPPEPGTISGGAVGGVPGVSAPGAGTTGAGTTAATTPGASTPGANTTVGTKNGGSAPDHSDKTNSNPVLQTPSVQPGFDASDDQADDNGPPGLPAAVPMPPDDYRGLTPFGNNNGADTSTNSGTNTGGSSAADGTQNQTATNAAPSTESYISEVEKVGIARWDRARYPLKIYIEPASKAKGFRPEFVSILTQAFKDWGKMIPSVPMQFVDNPTFSQISCTWTDNKADLMSSMEGGNTVVVPDDLGILHADMKILTTPPTQFPSMPNNFVRHVALHEVGHALGISAHSSQSGDIMYGIIYPKDESRSLSSRDQKTLLALYTMSIKPGQRLDPAKTGIAGDASNPKVRALKLNNESAEAMKAFRMDVAEGKLKEAHKLDPSNKMITGNLGAIYANLGAIAGMARNFPLATQYFKQAIPLLESSNNKPALGQVLTNYAQILQGTNNTVELKNVQAKLQSLR
jgi:predicted Zn-dependent protease